MVKAKVLVVEDDVHLLSGIRDILEIEDYTVLTAKNGVEGLELLKDQHQEPPDVIISDIMMPEMDGFEFLEHVRAEDQWVSIPFIFLTAKSEKTDMQRGLLGGADVYLPKPFDTDDLLVAVDARLKRVGEVNRVTAKRESDLKQQILTILNHEFRTPLTLVVAYADMLRETETNQLNEDELNTFVKGVNSGADRLRRLIENFILLVEIRNGDAGETYAWRRRKIHNLDTILHDVRRQIFSTEGVRSCAIEIEEDLPEFEADQEFLAVAIRELIHNAFKFSDPETPIKVVVRRCDIGIELSVHDQGRGLPESEHLKVWEPFYQYNRALYEDQGSGTGLAIVKGVVEMHQGEYAVQSAVDQGSVFTIRLPLEISKTNNNKQ